MVNTTPADVQQNTTDDKGCATFVGLKLVPTYQASVDVPGYVSPSNKQKAPDGGLLVDTSLGGLVRGSVSIDYAKARSFSVSLATPAGATTASSIPLRIGRNSPALAEYTPPICTSTVIAACTTGLPGTVQALYPGTYVVKAGACTEVDASAVNVDVSGKPSVVPTASIPLGAVTVNVKDLTGAPVVGRLVKFTTV